MKKKVKVTSSIDNKEWDKYMKKVKSLLPPIWVQQGMTKDQWDKKNQKPAKKAVKVEVVPDAPRKRGRPRKIK